MEISDIKIPKQKEKEVISEKLTDRLTEEELKKEEEAIRLGKIWMEKSKEVSHETEHASRVVQNSLKIYEEIKEKTPGVVEDIDENLIKLVGWWHDAYKSTTDNISVVDLFLEGKRSAQLVEEELKNYMKSKRLKRVLFAITYHPQVYFYFWRIKKTDPLLRIILEADGLDGTRKDRFWIAWQTNKGIFARIRNVFFYWGFIWFYGYIFPKTDYGKSIFKRNRSQEFLKVGKK